MNLFYGDKFRDQNHIKNQIIRSPFNQFTRIFWAILCANIIFNL